jgi:hypothetical protein
MSELAFNINGEAFEVPATATGWRVRRMKSKGAPEVVYGRDGMPLVLPIDADIEDLKRSVDLTGRYRVDPIDDALKAIEGAPLGYVHVNKDAPVAMTATYATSSSSDNIAIEAMRMNAELARTIVDRFPQMMEAAATLLRAADGAGLPARHPLVITEEDLEDEGQDAPAPPAGFDLNAIVAQLVPMLVTNIMSGKLKVPGLGAMLDWRKATPDAVHATERTARVPSAKSASATPQKGSAGSQRGGHRAPHRSDQHGALHRGAIRADPRRGCPRPRGSRHA